MANTRVIIIAVNIFGALDGFLPKALILEKLAKAKTAHGPNTQKKKIIIITILRLILIILYYPFSNNHNLILVNLNQAPYYPETLLVYENYT